MPTMVATGIPREPIDLAAHPHLPATSTTGPTRAAVLIATPGSSVKEATPI